MPAYLNVIGDRLLAKLIAILALGTIGVVGSAAEPEATLPPEVCAQKLQNIAVKARAIAEMTDREASYSEANGGRLSPESVQEYVQWYQRERSKPGSLLPELWRTDLTPAERARRAASVDQFSSERIKETKAAMEALLREAGEGCRTIR